MVAKKSTNKAAPKKPAETATANKAQTEAKAQSQTQIIEAETTSYQDGLAGISLYQGVVKMDFYKVLGMNADGSEVRKISDRIVMPASKLAEIEQSLQMIISALQKAQQQGNAPK